MHKRLQFYVFKNIASQIESGDDYRKLQPVYQIALFNDEEQEHHELIREYASLDKKYHDDKGSKCNRINLTKVGRIMKNKYDKFMEDMNLREEAWVYEKAEFDKKAHYYDGEAKGLVRGRVEGKAEQVVKFSQKKYPNEDTSWLESLTEKQYDEIFDKLLNDENLDEIKHRIDEMKKVVSFFMKI